MFINMRQYFFVLEAAAKDDRQEYERRGPGIYPTVEGKIIVVLGRNQKKCENKWKIFLKSLLLLQDI